MTGKMRHSIPFSMLAATILLSGCSWFSSDNVDEHATGQAAEKGKVAATDGDLIASVTEQIGTPMAERVATLGFLNKRNGLTRDLELRPGQSIRIGRAIVRLRACERTAPWELTPEQGAFVQLLVSEQSPDGSGKDQWKRVFSGWLFRESPSLNVVEHPIYDVWVKSCAMSFPDEEDPPEDSVNPTAPRASSSNLANSVSSAPNATVPEAAPPLVPAPKPAPAAKPAPSSNNGPEDLIGDLIAESEDGE
tara:strand:+ start:9453 stop:10199 length:747 start_codon:yes stop_codon:yes gene_type:complete